MTTHDAPGFCLVDGVARRAPSAPTVAAIAWLRDDLHLHSVHRSCDTGECGSCAVMVDGSAVKSCAVMAGELQGSVLTTPQGMASLGSPAAQALLQAMRAPGVFQCGYCMGAFLMAAVELLQRDAKPDVAAVQSAFDGLLCRCTGYQRIVEAVLAAAQRLRDDAAVAADDAAARLHHPATLAQAQALLRNRSGARLLAGGQQVAQQLGTDTALHDWISLRRLPELQGIAMDGDTLRIGSGCTHAQIAASPVVQARAPALAQLAAGLGDAFMRNRGTLGGALFDLEPGSAWPAALLATGAVVQTTGRTVDAERWCADPAVRAALARDEIVTAVHIPVPRHAVLRCFQPVPGRLALVSVFVALRGDDASIGVSGYAQTAFRSTAAARWWAADEEDAIAWEQIPLNDLRGDADYREAITLVQLRQARSALMQR